MSTENEYLYRLLEEKHVQIVGIEAEYKAKMLKTAFEMQELLQDCLRAGISYSEAARRLGVRKSNFHRTYGPQPSRGPIAEYNRRHPPKGTGT